MTWLTTVMEVLFAGSMLSLASDVVARSSPRARRYAPGAVAAGTIAASIALLAQGWAGSLGQMLQLQPVQSQFASLYLVDRFSTFVAFTVLVVGLAAVTFALDYYGPGERSAPFYSLLLVLLSSLVGVVSAGDFLTLFLFWEGMSVSAYGLVAFGRTRLSLEAAVKYFIMAGIGSLLALYGISAVYVSVGSIQLQAVQAATMTAYGQLGVALILVGLGVEAAVVPLHTWLPDVYSAAGLPVAAVVSGAVTGTGVFALLKVVQPLVAGGGFGTAIVSGRPSLSSIQLMLAALALLTMLIGNLSALSQGNLRRILSFSSIAQTGYMLAALSTLSVLGLVAVVFTIWNQGLLKSGFFMTIGKGSSEYGSASLEKLKGAGRSNRLLGMMYASSSLAMVGAPPFGMFWSEILVVQSLLAASGLVFGLLAAAVLLNIVISIGYYFRIVNTVVFGETEGAPTAASSTSAIPPVALLCVSLATGLAPFLILGQVL